MSYIGDLFFLVLGGILHFCSRYSQWETAASITYAETGTYKCKYSLLSSSEEESHDLVVNVLDSDIVVNDFEPQSYYNFELQSYYNIHFRTDTLGKGMNSLIISAMD